MSADRQFHRKLAFEEAKRRTLDVKVGSVPLNLGPSNTPGLKSAVRRSLMRRLSERAPWRAPERSLP